MPGHVSEGRIFVPRNAFGDKSSLRAEPPATFTVQVSPPALMETAFISLGFISSFVGNSSSRDGEKRSICHLLAQQGNQEKGLKKKLHSANRVLYRLGNACYQGAASARHIHYRQLQNYRHYGQKWSKKKDCLKEYLVFIKMVQCHRRSSKECNTIT